MATERKVVPIRGRCNPEDDEARRLARGWRRVLEMGERARRHDAGEPVIRLERDHGDFAGAA